METDTLPATVDTAFGVALLFGCDTTAAEAAVLDGIGACEDLSHRSLLIEAVGSTLRRRASSAEVPAAAKLLPVELRRLFRLQPLLRDCFVLRILLGVSPEVCTGLLNITVTDFEDALYAALRQLPLLFSPNVEFCDNQRHPKSACGHGQRGWRECFQHIFRDLFEGKVK
jgi:hypothetical protein